MIGGKGGAEELVVGSGSEFKKSSVVSTPKVPWKLQKLNAVYRESSEGMWNELDKVVGEVENGICCEEVRKS